tara:strand:+ start:164 stop:865 length:702 start_codon:yes stop_codon:yes gene_type:complete
MATFQTQIQGLTGFSLSGSTDPTLDEITQFLRDGTLEITNRWVAIHPQDIELFSRVSAITSSNDSLSVHGAKIISVLREAEVANDWRNCRYIHPALQSRVTDTESMHYASKYFPAYSILENGIINVFPAPDGTNDRFKVYYVNNDPVDNDDNNLAYNSNSIKYFPDDKVYLVALYAAIKSLEAKMAFYATEEEDAELVAGIQANIGLLLEKYERAFMGEAQAIEQRRRDNARE